MSDERLPPVVQVPGRRILVVDDLGPVGKGDHVVMVANVIVAVDTSRRREDTWLSPPTLTFNPETPQVRGSHHKKPVDAKKSAKFFPSKLVSVEDVLGVVSERQPINAKHIADYLDVPRKDGKARAHVTFIISNLKTEGRIAPHPDDISRIPRYMLSEPRDAAGS